MNYLQQQLKIHPSMEYQDVIKLCYQACYGAEHLLQDEASAYTFFQKEFEETTEKTEALMEDISDDFCRVNLGAYKKTGMPAIWLFHMFAMTTKQKHGDDATFLQLLQQAEEEMGSSFKEYVTTYLAQGIQAVHHSQNYKLKEAPAYRLVDRKYARLLPLLESIKKERCVIAIDGRSASGKTTIAQEMKEITDCSVVHMDDFFLPKELRSPERYAQPGGNVHYERFKKEVVDHLKDNQLSYQIFDCSILDYNGKYDIDSSGIVLIEGAYAFHPYFGNYADVKVFSDIDPQLQMQRIIARNGKEKAEMFKDKWIPLEENYFKALNIEDKADLIIKARS